MTGKSEHSGWARWHRLNRANFSSLSVRFRERISETTTTGGAPESSLSPKDTLDHILSVVQGLSEAPGHYGAVLKIFFREVSTSCVVPNCRRSKSNRTCFALIEHPCRLLPASGVCVCEGREGGRK